MAENTDSKDLQEELDRTRAMLLQSAKLAELGQQVASLVHEMNQPLMGIKAFAQMLKKQLEDNAPAQRRAAFIEEQAIVLEKLTARLRRYSRKSETAAMVEKVNLADTAHTVVALIGHRLSKAGVTTEVEIPADLPLVSIGDVHAQQLLVNLVTNAADAVEGREDRRVLITAGTENGRVLVMVSDSGSGIAQEVREQIFEPFYTTKGADRGTGLGLPICREIVRSYGGEIEVFGADEAEALVGRGMQTVMRISLPVAE